MTAPASQENRNRDKEVIITKCFSHAAAARVGDCRALQDPLLPLPRRQARKHGAPPHREVLELRRHGEGPQLLLLGIVDGGLSLGELGQLQLQHLLDQLRVQHLLKGDVAGLGDDYRGRGGENTIRRAKRFLQ